MPFADIVGHKKQIENLKWALAKGRLHHAYLFLGPEGVGKRTVALSLAMAVQCLEKVQDFCGRCAECVRIRGGNHPDVRMVGLLERKKEIGIEQVRELGRELNFRAFAGKKKIAIVDPASLMNFSAQNALLKTLEEPPKDSLLVLVAASAGGLLPTLLSRCLRLSFAPIPVAALADFLLRQRGLERPEAELRASVSMGSLGRAVGPDVEELARQRKLWGEKMCSLAQGDKGEWRALAEEVAGAREESLKFLEWLRGWYHDMLIYRVAGSRREIANPDLERLISGQAGGYSLRRIFFLLSEAARTEASIRRNVNRRIALENFFAHAAGLH